jgi:hypothetical protein
VGAVAVHSDTFKNAGYNALGEGPCTGPAAGTFAARPTTTAAVAGAPELTQTFTTKRFRPRLILRAPEGWKVKFDNGHAFALSSGHPSGADDQVAFFLDPYASPGDGPKHPGGAILANVSRTPTGLVAWLRSNPSLKVTAPDTLKLGTPVLTAKSVDVDLSSSAGKEDPHCPRACISYLAFRGRGYRFPYGTGLGEPARLFFALIRIDDEVHTLAIAVDSPSRAAFTQVLPAAAAVLESLRIDAVPVLELSPFSTQCTKVFGGTCLGELAAGTHSTSTFRPGLTYTVPVGWTNFSDHEGFVEFVPPGGDWQAVNANKSDYLAVIPGVAPARSACSDKPAATRTVDGFVRSLRRNPALDVRNVHDVAIGGLSGVVADIRMRSTWKRPCPWSHDAPAVDVLVGVPPAPTGIAHNVTPQPMVMRLYLLRYKGGALGIEVDEVGGDAKLAAYDMVVQSFRFDAR